MEFTKPAGQNLVDRQTVVGRPHTRIDGPLKVTGTAHYAYEHNDAMPNPAYGWIVGSGIGKGRVTGIDTAAAEAAPGVLAVLTTLDQAPLAPGLRSAIHVFGGAEAQHYHQAIALVVAETFEAARAAAYLLDVDYAVEPGRYDLMAEAQDAKPIADRRSRQPRLADRRPAWRLRGSLRRRPGHARRDVHDPRPVACDDGAARHHGRLVGRQAHRVDVGAGGQLAPSGHRQLARARCGRRAARGALHRRRLRLEAPPSGRRPVGGARGEGSRASGEGRAAAADHHEQWHTACGNAAADPPRFNPRRQADGDQPPQPERQRSRRLRGGGRRASPTAQRTATFR